MSMTRRQFNKTGLGAGIAAVLGGPAIANGNGLTRREIPSSGQEIPIVGVGTNRYGVGDDVEMRTPLRAALSKFHELGGTVIDTAPGYRSSETVLGDLIADLGIRDDLFMATKVDQKSRVENDARMERSFRLLKYEHIDLMQCHDFVGWEDAIPLMKEWQEEGRIRYVGVTSSRENQYELMEKVMREHDLDFIQVNYSLANQRKSAERILPLAADRGMAVLLNRPFGGGSVFGRLLKAEMPEWAADFDVDSWAQLLLKYALSHPATTAAIPGMTKERHVVDNMQAASGRMPDAAQRRKMEEFFDAL